MARGLLGGGPVKRLRVAYVALSMTVMVAHVGCSSARSVEADTSSALENPPLVFDVGSEAETQAFDRVNAYGLMRLSALAYDPPGLRAALGQRGIDVDAGAFQTFADSGTGTFAFYVEAQGAAFLVFRGTDPGDWTNWADDLDYAQTPEVVGNAHLGFDLAAMALYDHGLADYLKARNEANPGNPLYIAGHSLGAAMATIVTAHALLDPGYGGASVTALYTFASPRVGDAVFAQGLAAAMDGSGTFFARVVYECDPVTNVPVRAGPPTFVLDYQHVARGSDENDFVEWLHGGALVRAIPTLACPLVPFATDIGQHLPQPYVAALQACRPSPTTGN
jgi:Lipase (class 3)